MLHSLFDNNTVNDIFCIRILSQGKDQRWVPGSNGLFSVKTSYGVVDTPSNVTSKNTSNIKFPWIKF